MRVIANAQRKEVMSLEGRSVWVKQHGVEADRRSQTHGYNTYVRRNNMHKKKFIIGVILGIGLAVVAGRVEAKDKPFHARFAGIDTNKDDFSFTGTGASHITVAGKS